MAAQRYIPMYSSFEDLLNEYVLDICLPLTFKVKDQEIRFKDQEGNKGLISLNNFDIFFNKNYCGKLVSEIRFSDATCSSSGIEKICFCARSLTRILNADRKPIVDVNYDDFGNVEAIHMKNKSYISGLLNLLPGIKSSIKHYCIENFKIDLSLFEIFTDSKKRKLTEDDVIKMLNE